MTPPTAPTWHDYDPDGLIEGLEDGTRLMVFGDPGSGKSRLCADLADALLHIGRECLCVNADPASPAFGPPGTLSLGRRQREQWQVLRREALCTLDAGRFRLPLCQIVTRLMDFADDRPVLIDAPGLTRGIAAAELLPALVDAAGVDHLVVLGQPGTLPLPDELAALPCAITRMRSHPDARQPTTPERRNQRSQRWNAFLAQCEPRTFNLDHSRVTGTPPPRFAPQAWVGRQIAVLDRGHTVALGEVRSLDGNRPTAWLDNSAPGDTLLIRNAVRKADRTLGTAAEPVSRGKTRAPVLLGEPNQPMHFTVGRLNATLHNGVFGDPMLEVSFNTRQHCVLFDLGEAGHLPARLAHRVSDVFFSHAHFDHIGGFPWLLRARLLPLPACRLYGPPGLAQHIASWIGGVRWDRIGEQAPEFHIQEVHGDRIEHYRIVTGGPLQHQATSDLHNGLLLSESGFRVRTVTLDHDIPVLAYALEHANKLSIRETALRDMKQPPGPWLGDLKQAVQHNRMDETLTLPDGTEHTVRTLADRLVEQTPGETLVYATDLADTQANRTALIGLARGADAFVCEAPFLQADREQARSTQHLTARACGEIAAAAGVKRLVPFHFSKRYKKDAGAVYREIEEGFGRSVQDSD
ncbi:Clp1/GlmU family protein [Saccharospirillum salsuginis]|uniref:Uncharacterized protein n=1 Tax=Saccharospirillum salsuginis TaxID=418750 RepID=A0A918K0G2_9GAMM|nr:Clp1/GlmU family protein [Saccharospirillum salsuginis]GGX41717.1 hypothetical protein GCM10007392_05780 [Saccharospirillum salsuginis]